LFPQFIQPETGSVAFQCFQLGFTQMAISFTVNFLIVISAAKAAKWFSQNLTWVKVQKWFMATVLTTLAIKMFFSKVK
jgi:threonine/homoserine/homoserine lactone efflux protein